MDESHVCAWSSPRSHVRIRLPDAHLWRSEAIFSSLRPLPRVLPLRTGHNAVILFSSMTRADTPSRFSGPNFSRKLQRMTADRSTNSVTINTLTTATTLANLPPSGAFDSC